MKYLASSDLKEKNQFYRAILNEQNKKKLTNKDFTIISSNCNGSLMLSDLGMQFKSPFVNLYVRPSHFIQYLTNIEHYRNCKLEFVKDKKEKFPIAYLDDVEIRFLHYTSEKDAEEKWVKRTQRMNMQNFFVIMSERDGCTYEDLKKFNALPIENKLVFTHKPYPEFESAVYIPGFEKDKQIGVLLDFSGCCGYRYYDYFDYISWFNGASLASLKNTLEEKPKILGNKTVIGIRTHRWTHAEENLYTQLQQYFDSKDIFVVIDETAHTIDTPQHIQKISLNHDYLNQNKLFSQHPHPNGLGWLCGDYFYYALADHVDADYYWLIEPDVAFTFDDLSGFFGRFQMATQDALLHNFAQAPTTWAWTERAKIIHDDVYQAFLPLSRLSFKAIADCKRERQKASAHFIENNIAVNQFPNGESLIATSLVKHKLNIEKLNHFFPNGFQHFTYRNTILGNHAKNLLPSQQVVYPFRQPEYLGEMLAKQMPTIEMNDTMLDSILRSTIGIDDIDNVMQHIQQKVLSQIHVALKCHAMHKTLFLSIKNRFDAIAATPNPTIRYKSWIWKNNTLLLDATIVSSSNTHALEFIFEDDNLSCNLFSRSGGEKLLEIVRQKYAEYPLINQKVALFQQQNLTNIENEMIEKAIGIFNQVIQQIGINEQEAQP